MFLLVLPFVLTNLSGNPHIAYYLLGEDDGESFNVMLARAEDTVEDMLFIGGDFNNQGFSAWKRIE